MATTTRERFLRMDFISQARLKQNLLRDIFSRVCDALSTQKLQDFAPVLDKHDLQELMKLDDRHSGNRVIMDLLLKVQRSLKKNPTWWQILETILREEDMDLYYAMNPWEREEDMRGGAAGGGGGGGGGGGSGRGGRGGGGGGGGGVLTPNIPERSGIRNAGRIAKIQTTYTMDTPLLFTTGVHCFLEALCARDDMLWRDLADGLGLRLGDQLKIIEKSKNNAIHRLLLDQFIQLEGEAATMGRLIAALQGLGREGHCVVRQMEQAGIIFPMGRAGSEADGEVAGVQYDGEREGGASVMSSQAPTPRATVCSRPTSAKPILDLSNLSCCESDKEKQPDKNVLTETGELSLQKSQSVVNKEQLESSQMAGSSIATRREATRPSGLNGERSASTDSIVDNARQSPTDRHPDNAPANEEKPLNYTPKSSRPGAKEETSTRTSETSQINDALETDTPSSQQALGNVPPWIHSSQQEIQEEVIAASQHDTNSIQPPCPGSPAHLPKQVNFHFTINKVDTLMLAQKHNNVSKHQCTNEGGEEGEGGGDEEPVFDPPIPATTRSSGGTEHTEFTGDIHQHPTVQETYKGENCDGSSEGCTSPSCDPHPMDINGHQTILKRPHMHHEVPEEHDDSEEPLEEDFDVVDLRENHHTVTSHASSEEYGDEGQEDVQKVWTQNTDSVSSDSSVALPSGEAEERDHNSSVHHDPIVSQQPPQQSDLIHGQPSPIRPAEQQPQNYGVMTVFSRAWHSVKEAYLHME